jgi:hypothetical protein
MRPSRSWDDTLAICLDRFSQVRLDADFKVGDGEPVRMLKYGEAGRKNGDLVG